MDIIFFAVIAFYVFFKLSKQLGRVDEEEKKIIEEKINKRKKIIEDIQNQIIVGQSSTKGREVKEVKNESEAKIISNLDESSKTQFLSAIKACNISPEFFLNGAKSAFEMVIKAFSAADFQTLKFLLDEKTYLGFEQSINSRKAAHQILVTNLIAIDKAEILLASTFGNDALITVRFISRQINYITNQNGELVEGRKDEIMELNDVWKFKKDITASSPNWFIVSTHSN